MLLKLSFGRAFSEPLSKLIPCQIVLKSRSSRCQGRGQSLARGMDAKCLEGIGIRAGGEVGGETVPLEFHLEGGGGGLQSGRDVRID